jgi:ubiquinone/menaquinone biosynthesis C-methylase UbiE
MDSYMRAFEASASHADRYLLKSLQEKTEQQKRLEQILDSLNLSPQTIADVACGAGGLSYHLSRKYPQTRFTLVDLGEIALGHARTVAKTFNSEVIQGDACDLPLPSDAFDLVFFWQTLSWIDTPELALRELVRICKPGGRIFISSLFNTESDVDLYTSAIDYTRGDGVRLPYNCFSARTIASWTDLESGFHDFQIDIDIPQSSRGLGTYTVRCEDGRRLQISAGILMNWKILELRKH